jgi:hypothetical protein
MLESILNFLRRVFLGGCICLASSGNRVELTSGEGVKAIDSSGNIRVQIPTSGTSILIRAHDTTPGTIEFGSVGKIYANTLQMNFEVDRAGLYLYTGATSYPGFRLEGGAAGQKAILAGFSGASYSEISLAPQGVAAITARRDTVLRLGFFGAPVTAKPTVTGSRGGNAALASLLTALANLGLITDSTTA